MNIVEQGQGTPIVLVPGSQGRWEYMRPTVDALARFFRVITFSLCDEPSADCRIDSTRGLDNYATQIEAALDQTGVTRAAVCGVSFGGLAALRFAATQPSRTSALVLVSTPGPGWHLRPRHETYVRVPWLFGPIFFAEAPWRVRKEIRLAIPERKARLAFGLWSLRTLCTATPSVSRIAARARLIGTLDIEADCARLGVPTLVVTGERALDHVVSVDGTSEYVRRIKGATAVVLERSGHLGSITRPDAFAAIVRDFVNRHRHAAA